MSDNPLAPEAHDEVNAILPGLVEPHARPLVVVGLNIQLIDEVYGPGEVGNNIMAGNQRPYNLQTVKTEKPPYLHIRRTTRPR